MYNVPVYELHHMVIFGLEKWSSKMYMFTSMECITMVQLYYYS